MKLNILMVMMITSGLLACQNQPMKSEQHGRVKLAPTLQWHKLQTAGYSGAMPENMSDYLLLTQDAKQRAKTKLILQAQLQHDPTGEKELLYITNLLKVLDQEPAWVNETREALWSRQLRRADVPYELVNFYSHYPQQPDLEKLKTLISQSDQRLAPNQRIWLWGMLRLPDMLKTQTTLDELAVTCQKIASTTSAFGYVQPSNLQLCHRAQLMLLRQQGSHDSEKLLADIGADLNAGRLQGSDLLPLMNILQSNAGGAPMDEQTIALGRLGEGKDPAVALAVIALLLNQTGDEAETVQLEQELMQLRQQGELQASYLLGRLYLEGQRKVADPVIAEKMLLTAKELPEAGYLLGRLYISGLLGEPSRVQLGVDALVQSARKGYVKSDAMLADSFHDGPGVKGNFVYAWVFATLVLQQQPTNARQLRVLAAINLDSDHQLQANVLLQRERLMRVTSAITPIPVAGISEPKPEFENNHEDISDTKEPDLVSNF
jgi:TPR repeat protein